MFKTKSARIKALLTSALSVALAVILLGYSGYAWMSMSKTVKAVANNIRINAPSNLEISLTGVGDDWHDVVDVDMKALVEDLLAADANPFDADDDSFYLLPASSINGFNGQIWRPTNYRIMGGVLNDLSEVAFNAATPVSWATSTSSFDGYYIDVPLYIRTSGQGAIGIKLSAESEIINTRNARDAEGTSGVEDTVRVAFLNPGTATNSNGQTTPLVYALTTHSTATVVTGTASDALALSTPTYLTAGSNTKLFDVPTADYSGGTLEYGIKSFVVRIWIEGQDSNCLARIGGTEFSVKLVFDAIE